MKLGKYILGLAIVAAGLSLTSCDQENEGAIFEGPAMANVSFAKAAVNAETEETTITIPVVVTRTYSAEAYTANIVLAEGKAENVKLKNNQVTFAAGEQSASTELEITDIQEGDHYTCVLKLSDADANTANKFDSQNHTMTIKVVRRGWIDAGTCTFMDYTFGNGETAENVPIQNAEGTNIYRIVAPYYYTYPEDDATMDNIVFTLYDDGSISMQEGDWFTLWDYGFYYDSANWGSYCNTAVHEDNLYEVNFLLKVDGAVTSTAAFMFKWDK